MKMKEKDICNDDFLKKMFKNTQLEEPSGDFTNRVMDRVMQEWLTKPVVEKKSRSWKGWFGLFGFIVMVGLVLLVTDVRKLIQLADNPFWDNIDSSYLQPVHDAFAQLFLNLLTLPVIVYIIFVAMILLTLLDRILVKMLQLR